MRLRALLRTQPRRALLQSAQALPRYRHTLRQTRQKFPCRSAASCDYNLAQLKTGPSPELARKSPAVAPPECLVTGVLRILCAVAPTRRPCRPWEISPRASHRAGRLSVGHPAGDARIGVRIR